MGIGPGLFITGTDTGVGKTFITSAIVGLLREQGRLVGVCKPVATGARWDGSRWLSEDTVRLARAAGLPPERVTRWTFPEAAAPPVAARRQGVNLTLPDLIRAVEEQSRSVEAILVEGVGGFLCPLTERETVADLARALGLSLVVVARRTLGTLNHTLLTLEVARGRGLSVAGIVVNETAKPRGLADHTNVDELVRRITVPLLAVVPFHAETVGVTTGLETVDWWRLCHQGRTGAE